MPPRFYTLPPGVAAADAIAQGVLDRLDGDPLALADATLYVPTRRAARAMTEAFLRRGGGRPLLTPRMIPLGDVEVDDLDVEIDADAADDGLEIPPTLSPLRRRLTLARLIIARDAATGAAPPLDRAAALARELGRLLDEAQEQGCDWTRLAALAPEHFAEHWRLTAEFLQLVAALWPEVLAEAQATDPALRRAALIKARIAAWRAQPPQGLILAAGSTGSIPAVAELLAAIAALPQGGVILPGLDRGLDPDAWDALPKHPTHPQHGLHRLLAQCGVDRRDVADWPIPADLTPPAPGRATLWRWATHPTPEDVAPPFGLDPAAALAGAALVEAPDAAGEALVCAAALREGLERPGATCALITPDRGLARRVAAILARWEVAADDSAGQPLERTAPGALLFRLAEATTARLAPIPLLGLLKHPLVALGQAVGKTRAAARALELAALRGPRPGPGLAGLRAALTIQLSEEEPPPVKRRASKRKIHQALALLDPLDGALGPFLDLCAQDEAPLDALIAALAAAAEALAASDEDNGAMRLWRGDAGVAAAAWIEDILEAAPVAPPVARGGLPALLRELAVGRAVRPSWGKHPRLFLWSPQEARLQHADRLVLAGLNEGVWPRDPGADPFLSRPMRKEFGLPPAERRIGQAAQDLALAVAAPEVILTRALKSGGAPTRPARWLARLDAALATLPDGPAAGTTLRARGAAWLALARGLDRPDGPPQPCAEPRPTPPVAARPRRLPATGVELWMRNPYGLYARYVLGLRKLDPIDAAPGRRELGDAIHKALELYNQRFPQTPADPAATLAGLAEEAFADLADRPGARMFALPRFRAAAHWLAGLDADRRALSVTVLPEVKGATTLKGFAGGDFVVEGRADRIERRRDGTLAVIDYKTGTPPGKGEADSGAAPQLPILGMIAQAGGFEGAPAGALAALEFWKPPGAAGEGKITALDAPDLKAKTARAGLERVIARFDDPTTPYAVKPLPDRAPRFDDYAHLSRIREWAGDGDEG